MSTIVSQSSFSDLRAFGISTSSKSESSLECEEETECEEQETENGQSPKDDVRVLNRIAEVRKQQGISLRTIARRTGLEVKVLREQEDPAYDLRLHELVIWQKALDVPAADLIECTGDPLSRPVRERAQLLRIMKTAATMREVKATPRVRRLAEMLCEQLEQLMPELKEIGAWPQYGSRRGNEVLGKILENPVSTDLLKNAE